VPQPVPVSGWDYTDTTMLNAVKLTSGNFGGPGSFGPTALYEFTYIAKQPVVVGLGFASLRDLATFLRNAKTDDNGVANPLVGDVRAIYTVCSSQPCRTTRDFVLFGFNEAEHSQQKALKGQHLDHEKVFDGMLNWKGGGSGIFMNYRFAQPGRTHRQHIARWTPEIQFPFADVEHFRPGYREIRQPARPLPANIYLPQNLRSQLGKRILGQSQLRFDDRWPGE